MLILFHTLDVKKNLNIFMARKIVDNAREHSITATEHSVLSNRHGNISDTSSKEKTNILIIAHAVDDATSGCTVCIYSQDTDVLLLGLKRVALLVDNDDAATSCPATTNL